MNKSFATLYAQHICGGNIRVCNTCNRQFCAKCEGNICKALAIHMKACCREAILEYVKKSKEPTPKTKMRTDIEEITDGKL